MASEFHNYVEECEGQAVQLFGLLKKRVLHLGKLEESGERKAKDFKNQLKEGDCVAALGIAKSMVGHAVAAGLCLNAIQSDICGLHVHAQKLFDITETIETRAKNEAAWPKKFLDGNIAGFLQITPFKTHDEVTEYMDHQTDRHQKMYGVAAVKLQPKDQVYNFDYCLAKLEAIIAKNKLKEDRYVETGIEELEDLEVELHSTHEGAREGPSAARNVNTDAIVDAAQPGDERVVTDASTNFAKDIVVTFSRGQAVTATSNSTMGSAKGKGKGKGKETGVDAIEEDDTTEQSNLDDQVAGTRKAPVVTRSRTKEQNNNYTANMEGAIATQGDFEPMTDGLGQSDDSGHAFEGVRHDAGIAGTTVGESASVEYADQLSEHAVTEQESDSNNGAKGRPGASRRQSFDFGAMSGNNVYGNADHLVNAQNDPSTLDTLSSTLKAPLSHLKKQQIPTSGSTPAQTRSAKRQKIQGEPPVDLPSLPNHATEAVDLTQKNLPDIILTTASPAARQPPLVGSGDVDAAQTCPSADLHTAVRVHQGMKRTIAEADAVVDEESAGSPGPRRTMRARKQKCDPAYLYPGYGPAEIKKPISKKPHPVAESTLRSPGKDSRTGRISKNVVDTGKQAGVTSLDISAHPSPYDLGFMSNRSEPRSVVANTPEPGDEDEDSESEDIEFVDAVDKQPEGEIDD